MPIQNVKIGAIFFDVEYGEGLQDERGEKVDGCLQHNHERIRIESKMGEQAKAQTLLHEIVHEIDFQYALHLKDDSVIDRIAFGWYQVMRDNPELVKLITE